MDGFLLLYQRQRELHRYIIQEWELGLNLTFLIFFHSFQHLKIDHKITRSSRAFYGLSTPPCRPCRIRYSVMDVLISANEAIFEHRVEHPMGNSRDISRYIDDGPWSLILEKVVNHGESKVEVTCHCDVLCGPPKSFTSTTIILYWIVPDPRCVSTKKKPVVPGWWLSFNPSEKYDESSVGMNIPFPNFMGTS